jgi:hypothetical protein
LTARGGVELTLPNEQTDKESQQDHGCRWRQCNSGQHDSQSGEQAI